MLIIYRDWLQFQLRQAVNEIPDLAANSKFIALTDSNVLLTFAPDSPADAAYVEVTGVDARLIGIDTRPANGLVYGITATNNIYTIAIQIAVSPASAALWIYLLKRELFLGLTLTP